MVANFDVVVIGARCAGSSLAMLLARRGYQVLVVDRAELGSDTSSTHLLHPPGVAAMARWGLLDALVATGCPPIGTYSFDFGSFVISGAPGEPDNPVGYCPRRTVLDRLLAEAAAQSGAEIRDRFSVTELIVEDGAVVGVRGHGDERAVDITARVVVGADGPNSTVAKAVDAERYHDRSILMATYYSYWSDVPGDGFSVYIRGDDGFGTIPTHDGLTVLVGGWPHEQMAANRSDVEGRFRSLIEQAPDCAARFSGAQRQSRWVGMAVPNFFRKPYGPGWVLVGDAGYIKDPITGQGMSDAFRTAEHCVEALDAVLSGARPWDEAMGEFHQARDEAALPMFEFTCQVATPGPPPPEMGALLAAVSASPEAAHGFARVWSGVLSPAEFFAPDNVGRIMAGDGV